MRACTCSVVALVSLDKIESVQVCVHACVVLLLLFHLTRECACVRACTCSVVALVSLDKIVNECTCMHACVLLLLFLLLE